MRPTRFITVVALFQALAIMVGFFAVSVVFKFHRYGADPTLFRHQEGFNLLPVFLFEHAWVPFVCPLAWTFYAVQAERVDQGWLSERASLVIGIALATALAIMYLFAAAHAVRSAHY